MWFLPMNFLYHIIFAWAVWASSFSRLYKSLCCFVWRLTLPSPRKFSTPCADSYFSQHDLCTILTVASIHFIQENLFTCWSGNSRSTPDLLPYITIEPRLCDSCGWYICECSIVYDNKRHTFILAFQQFSSIRLYVFRCIVIVWFDILRIPSLFHHFHLKT